MLALVGVVALCAVTTNAHNWVNSPSRSEFASTVNPGLPSQTGLPHARVIANQDVQVEWVNGHDSDCYWILLPEKDGFKNMLKQNTAMLEDYINNAPTAQQVPPAARWQKYHRKYNSNNLDNKAGDAFFQAIIKPTDNNPNYIPRPDTFEGSFSGAPSLATRNVSLFFQAVYYQNNSCTMNDRRVAYKNDKYPWVLAVHRYRLCTGQGGRPDVARLTFPAGTPPGRYFAQWQWRGYYDIVDIEIVAGTTPVVKPYGEKVPPPPKGQRAQYRRVDHCAFPDATPISGCYRILTDADACMRMCDQQTEFACTGVQITPVLYPTSAYKGFSNVSFMPYDFPSVCRKSDIERGANSKHLACWPLQARAKTDTVDRMIVTTDPDDPAFYSTCMLRISYKVASNTTVEAPPRDPTWNYRSKCIGCDDAQTTTIEYALPVWNVSNVCANCDVDGRPLASIPESAKPVNWSIPAPWKRIGNAACRGLNNATENPNYTCVNSTGCHIQLMPAGGIRADVSQVDCELLVKNDPRCSNLAVMRFQADNNDVCWCWTGKDHLPNSGKTGSNSCCGTCVPQNMTGMAMFDNSV